MLSSLIEQEEWQVVTLIDTVDPTAPCRGETSKILYFRGLTFSFIVVAAFTLTVVMGMRFKRSRKLMPAGLMAGLR